MLLAVLGSLLPFTPVPRAAAAPPLVPTSFGVGTWTYQVPLEVNRLLVDARGAAGGSNGAAPQSGRASRVQAVLLVKPGDRLTVVVGGRGSQSQGGFNGGGPGGVSRGYGGGGATDIRYGSSLSGRVLVAAGGGGQGGALGPGGGGGGLGGGTPGEPGQTSTDTTAEGLAGVTAGGLPGTLIAGGLGGTNTDCVECANTDGRAGSFGQGGAGGEGLNGGGGGGGGGYYGGGGGAGTMVHRLAGGGAGGGGGSSYVDPNRGLLVSMTVEPLQLDGAITLTPDPSADERPVVTQVSPAANAVFEGTTVPQFTISATDPDLDARWVGRIAVRDSLDLVVMELTTPPAMSGDTVTVSATHPLPPGSYRWVASAIDTRGAIGSRGPRFFTVTDPTPGHPLAASGGFEFNAPASLSTFPCPPPAPFGTGPCGGSFSGSWSGHLDGVTGDQPFSAAWSTGADRFQAAFQYAEWQCSAGIENVLGIARGTVTAAAQPGEVQGKWQVRGESFPRDVIGVSASFSFDWVRLGASAVLLIQPFELSLEVAGMGMQRVVTRSQEGTAAFVVTSANGVGGVPSCDQPLSDVQGHVVGTVPLVEASL